MLTGIVPGLQTESIAKFKPVLLKRKRMPSGVEANPVYHPACGDDAVPSEISLVQFRDTGSNR
jgi:hypothetical protein